MRKYRQDKEYDPEELKKGTEHELDDKHTKSCVEAKRIAKDHLDDDPKYYSKLAKFDLDERKKKRKKRKKAGTESSKESSLRDWFKRRGAKGKKGGWVDCNAPDGKGGYKSCGRSKGEKRKKYPACRPTPSACKERGRGKSWGKKGSKRRKSRGRKKRNESMEMTTEEIRTIILEELQNVLDEKKGKRRVRKKKAKKKSGKKDKCYYKVKRRYKVWPSAYASGALSKCRKVGAKNWGNKSKKKNESIEEEIIQEKKNCGCGQDPCKTYGKINEEFKKHDMFDPKTGKKKVAKVEKDHHDLAKKGYTHIDPQEIIDLIEKEGGALGLQNLLDKFGKDQEQEIMKTLKGMSKVGQHKSGDYILDDGEEIKVVSESLQYHLDHGVGVEKNVFRPGSSEFFSIFREARQLFREGVYKIHSEDEKEIIESDLGEFGMFGEQMVPLDFPMLMEQEEDELIDEKKRKKKKKKDPPLNKPTKNTGGGKKYKVYVRSKSGGIKKITYGDAKGGLKGNWNNAEARTNFAKRHKCADKKDRTKAGYWACRAHKHFGKNVPGRFW